MPVIKLPNLLIASCVLVCLNTLADAQSYPIPEGEFHRTRWEAFQKGESKSRRISSKLQSFVKGVLVKDEMYVWEHDVFGRLRMLHRTEVDGKVRENERIQIDKVIYERENGGVWTKRDESQGGSGGGSGSVQELSQSTKELVVVDGKSATLYEEFRVVRNTDSLVYYNTKIWIDNDGLRIREETKSGALHPRTVNHQEVSTFIYDPNIKIGAPIK